METGAYCPDRASERDRRIRIIHFFQITKYYYFPIPPGKSLDGPTQGFNALAMREIHDRVVIYGQFRRSAFFRLPIEGDIEAPALQMPQNKLACDTVQITGESTPLCIVSAVFS